MTVKKLSDAVALLEWTRSIDGVGCSVTATVDGAIAIQLDGAHVPTAYATLGDTIGWDGYRFSVEQPGADQ